MKELGLPTMLINRVEEMEPEVGVVGWGVVFSMRLLGGSCVLVKSCYDLCVGLEVGRYGH